MLKIIRRSFRRVALGTLLILSANSGIQAGDFNCAIDLVPVPSLITTSQSPAKNAPVQAAATSTCPTELAGTQELCGWVDMKNEEVMPAIASPAISAEGLAATAVAASGVHVQQFVEPFAMVGPYLDNSLASVRRLTAWYEDLLNRAKQMRQAEMNRAINEIALEEPIDAARWGDSVLEEPTLPSIVVAKLDPLVGGSAFIFAIEETEYLAYDLAPRDLKLWSVLPTASRAYCIRSPSDLLADAVMWGEVDELVTATTENSESVAADIVVRSSPECLLDAVVWRVESLTRSPLVESLRSPSAIGRAIAQFVGSTGDLAADAVGVLASRFPKTDDRPSETGSKLLARAGIQMESRAGIEVDSNATEVIAAAPSENPVR